MRKSTFTTGINNNGDKFVTGITGVFDTRVKDTGCKFAADVNNTSGKLPQVSTSRTPVNNGNNIRLLTP
jgi:hypothetical protein